ncbi:Protein CBG04545 [Caenorhabditis briggsae]|uniref:Protein CBG04545 n=1 Tax=Caenorhabditis briggsae TaxID=6238 RepID=A8WXV8_CAEBR|nr:Protein CBG04545 [Caenorhabditis briggsae]CAP25221.2 Protein CBG04545 [Caenorhabditis briggsae]
MKRLGVDPPCGVLDPKEAVLLAVSCDAFAFGQEVGHQQRLYPTLQTAPPSNSVVNGSRETEWSVARTSQSSTTHNSGASSFPI